MKTVAPGDPDLQAILEDIQSQNRAIQAAVRSFHEEFKRELQDFREETRKSFASIFALVGHHAKDIGDLDR